VLILALSFDLMDEAYQRGDFDAPALGCLSSAAVYSAANWYLATRGAKRRKGSGGQHPSEGSRGNRSYGGSYCRLPLGSPWGPLECHRDTQSRPINHLYRWCGGGITVGSSIAAVLSYALVLTKLTEK